MSEEAKGEVSTDDPAAHALLIELLRSARVITTASDLLLERIPVGKYPAETREVAVIRQMIGVAIPLLREVDPGRCEEIAALIARIRIELICDFQRRTDHSAAPEPH